MLDQQIARAIITSLSSGTVAFNYSSCYEVGRHRQLNVVKNEIEKKNGSLRFVNGDYGTGKTHFLATIRYWALKNNYAPCHVILSPRGTPIYNLEAVYSRIIKNLIVNEQETTSPIETILEYVFEEFKKWLSKYLQCKDQRCLKTLINPLYCQHCNIEGAIEKLYIKNFDKLDRKLQIAIIIYRNARWGHHPDFETADLVIRWLEGEPLYRRDLNYLGVWEHVSKKDILKGLNEIAKLTSLLNKNGLIIMLDEAEGIEHLTSYQRPIAYDNLKFLIEGTSKIDNVYFLYATTPTFYQEISSYSSYLAKTIQQTPFTDLVPLTKNEIEELASKIINIFKTATGTEENYIEQNEQVIKDHIEKTLNRSLSVRDFITGLLNILQ